MIKLNTNDSTSESRNNKSNFFMTQPAMKTNGITFEKYTNRKGYIILTNSPPIVSYINTNSYLGMKKFEK